MKSQTPVLVIGGTRGTGLLIARLLHRQDQPVRVLARDRARVVSLFDPSVQVVEGDLTKPQTLGSAIGGAKHASAGSTASAEAMAPRLSTA